MCHHDVIVNFFWRYFVSLVKICYWSKFHVNIFTGSGVMTIYCIRDWPEVWKSEIPASEFCPVSGDWGKLGIANLAWMSLMKCYWMLQNASTVSELLKENQQGLKLPPPPRLGLMPLTILTKSSILDVWRGSKNATKSFSKSFCEFNIIGFSSDLVK